MSDLSEFWNIWITVIVIVGIVGLTYLVLSQSKATVAKGEQVGTTGHVWDEDLAEFHNPLPRWWMYMFYITLVFGVVYLVLYPGLGAKWQGTFGWTSVGQYATEKKIADSKYQPLYDKYLKQDIKVVAADPQAQDMGKRLFQTYCIQCHGVDAKGKSGFPNLTDTKWLWGGSPQEIQTTIEHGRFGVMAAWGEQLGEDKVKDVANYVMSLSKLPHDSARAVRGKEVFMQPANCMLCHGADGKGNKTLGAPDLTDNNWLYGGRESKIIETITNGRNNQMPAWKDFLGDAKVHLLTAYVWGLSNNPQAKQ